MRLRIGSRAAGGARGGRVEASVPLVAPSQAYAWWSDYRDGAHDHGFASWLRPERRVERLGPHHVRLHESARGIPGWREVEDVHLEPAMLRIRFDTQTPQGRFTGTYTFEPEEQEAAGTRVVVTWSEEPRGAWRFLWPLAAWAVRRVYAWDFRHHVRAMAADLTPKAAPR